MDWKKEFWDQSAHIAVGVVALLPIAVFGLNPLTGLIATGTIGFVREVTEYQCAQAVKSQLDVEINNMELKDFEQVGRLLIDQLPESRFWSPGSIRDLTVWAAIGFILGWL